MIELDQLKALWRWMRAHKLDKKWVGLGLVFIMTGVLFLLKGPASWLVEWLEESRNIKLEASSKVWEYGGEETSS